MDRGREEVRLWPPAAGLAGFMGEPLAGEEAYESGAAERC